MNFTSTRSAWAQNVPYSERWPLRAGGEYGGLCHDVAIQISAQMATFVINPPKQRHRRHMYELDCVTYRTQRYGLYDLCASAMRWRSTKAAATD